MNERRKFERKFLKIHAEIVIDDLHLQGNTVNVGEGGCLMQALNHKTLPGNMLGKVGSLWLTWQDSIVECTARVVRVQGTAVGIEIDTIDAEGLTVLKAKLDEF